MVGFRSTWRRRRGSCCRWRRQPPRGTCSTSASTWPSTGNRSTTSANIAPRGGGRCHVFTAKPGNLTIDHATTLRAWSPRTLGVPIDRDDELDAIVALRQSRYCESDRLAGFAASEFTEVLPDDPYGTAVTVSSWVFERLTYLSGVSGPLDSAVDTLLAGEGVCHDFAHLTDRALPCPAHPGPARIRLRARDLADGLPRRHRGAGRRHLVRVRQHATRAPVGAGAHRHRVATPPTPRSPPCSTAGRSWSTPRCSPRAR